MNTSTRKLYRIWLDYREEPRFKDVIQGFNMENTLITPITSDHLVQYDMLLNSQELLLLTLSVRSLDPMRIDKFKDEYGLDTVVYILSE